MVLQYLTHKFQYFRAAATVYNSLGLELLVIAYSRQ